MHVDFLKLLEGLADTGLDFVIVGGVAARLYGSPRLTHDVDVIPRFEAGSWEKTVDALWNMGARPRIPEPREKVRDTREVARWISEKGMLALSFRSTDGLAEIDFLVAEAGNFEALQSRATKLNLGSRTFLVAHIDDLIAMKLRAGRPQDLLDIEALQKIKDNRD